MRRQTRPEACNDGGVGRCHITALGRIGLQIEKSVLARQIKRLQLPVAITHDTIVAAAPEQRLVRHAGSALDEGQHIDPIDRPVARQGRAARRAGGGEDVEMTDHRVIAAASGDLRRPAHHEGHMRAAFVKSRLPAAIGAVYLGQANVMRAAIVGGKDHQRIVIKALRLQFGHDLADAAVERADHRGIDPQAVVLDLRQRIIIRLERLQRCVRSIIGEIHEERPVAVGPDAGQRLVGQIIGHVAIGGKARRTVELHAIRQIGPQEFVDRVETLL